MPGSQPTDDQTEKLREAALIQAKRLEEYFSGEEAEDRYNQLVRYAKKVGARYSFYGKMGADTYSKGSSPQDVVQHVLASVFNPDFTATKGRRVIPAEVSLEAALRLDIRSHIDHLAKHYENQKGRREADLWRSNEDGVEISAFEHLLPYHHDEDLADKEERDLLRQRVDRLIKFVSNDTIVQKMLLLIRDESLYSPAELVAERIGVTRDDIFKARKRLSSALGRFDKEEQKRREP